MNRAQLVNEVAKVTCTKKEAELAVDAAFGAIKKALKKGDSVTLVGLGTLSLAREKPAKAGTLRQVRSLK
jgi:nucleoid DNA-binding protein